MPIYANFEKLRGEMNLRFYANEFRDFEYLRSCLVRRLHFMQILCKFYDVIHSNLIYDFRLIANFNRRVTDGGQLPIVCKFYANFMQILWKKEVKEEIQFD